jgi:uncharacterized membrane protein
MLDEHRHARSLEAAVVAIVTGAVAAYWTTCSILIHRSFHSNAWDLGLIDQVLWNSAHGRLFEYSFRAMSYAGDHWQPFLLILIPVKWVHSGPELLLVVQAVVLAAAVIPLYAALRPSGWRSAGALAGAYLLGLGAAQAVSFDFHTEAFVPLLAFTALWGLARRRRLVFVAAGLLILTVREDSALLTLALCWIAWFAFRERASVPLAGAAAIYGLLAAAVIIPHFRGGQPNPFLERYGYLGGSLPRVLWSVVARPDLVVPQLARPEAIGAIGVVLASAAMLPLLVPRLLPPLAVVTLLSLLSKHPPQGALELHYLVVPSTVAILLAAVAVRDRVWERLSLGLGRHRATMGFALQARCVWPAALIVVPAVLLVLRSPLPPSFAADLDRFDVDHHAAVAQGFVREVPSQAIVSAQSPFVPHLSEREHIYEFPHIEDAEIVLLDDAGPVSGGEIAAGYAGCVAALPRLGFDEVRSEDGISLWRKVRAAEPLLDVPMACSGQQARSTSSRSRPTAPPRPVARSARRATPGGTACAPGGGMHGGRAVVAV